MPTTKTLDDLRDDFDQISAFPDGPWNHNRLYQPFLLRSLPDPIARALDIGCGRGEMARLLAARADHVIGIDLSPRMIEAARSSSASVPTINFQVADVMTVTFAPESFDCIASIATLHHLDLEAVLTRIKDWLKPGGMLIVLDLVKSTGLEYAIDALALPLEILMKRRFSHNLQPNPAAAAAWKHHGDAETYLTTREVRRIADRVVPGARVRRHLFWRYSLVWTKK